MSSTIDRVELLKVAKSNINAAAFAPTEQRIAEAKAAIQALFNYVESLNPAPKASPDKGAPKAKAVAKATSKPKATKRSPKVKTTPEDRLEAKAQAQSRGITTVFLPKEEKAVRPKSKGVDTPKGLLAESGNVEDAIRNLRTLRMQASMSDDMLFESSIEDTIDFSDVPF
jgi:hypothetical protein